MGRPPELQLPRPARWPPWAVAASIAVHLAIFAALILLYVPSRRSGGRHLLLSLAPQPAARPRAMPAMSFPTGEAIAQAAAVRSRPANPVAITASIPGASTAAGSTTPPDSATAWPGPVARGAIPWRSLGSGVLWDRRAMVPLLDARTHAELTDSAVKAIIRHYLDSLAALPGGGAMPLPSWKATIGGQEYGLDGTYITVAGVKIPALVLGLIPLPVAGNESKALDKGAWMRAQDYELALSRQAAAADQKEQIRAIRERNAREEELRQQQRASSREATDK